MFISISPALNPITSDKAIKVETSNGTNPTSMRESVAALFPTAFATAVKDSFRCLRAVRKAEPSSLSST